MAASLLSLTPESPFAPTHRTQAYIPNRRLSSIQEADENAARKGTITDDGVIVSPVEEKSQQEELIKGALSNHDSKEKKNK
jgi:hypothetical protein